MDDVKTENVQSEPVETTAAESTAQEQTTAEESTQVTPQPITEIERTIPYKRFQEVNSKFKEAQRKLAELEGSQQLNQYDPEDLQSVLGHPIVQEMMIKQAKQELTDYARETLDQYPTLNPAVKKAILANVRGFVKETTQDVESAKLDLQEYIEGIIEEADAQQPQAPKSFQVANTNVAKPDIEGTKPAEIAEILNKPVDEMSDEEVAIVQRYKNSKK